MAVEALKTVGNQLDQWARCDVSASTVCTLKITHFRNGTGREAMGDVESVARKVVGGLCYAGLLVASASEAIARAIITAPVLLYTMFVLNGDKDKVDEAKANYLLNLSFHGMIISGENVINCALAIVHSIRQHEQKIVYDDLIGCKDYHDNVFDTPPFAAVQAPATPVPADEAGREMQEVDHKPLLALAPEKANVPAATPSAPAAAEPGSEAAKVTAA